MTFAMKMPEVSVIIPAFNAASYIRNAIQSVLDQTLDAVEVIVVDDGSRDHTVEVVKSVQDKRVRLYQLPENRGVSAARNTALAQARGK
ncbi:MAG: glycosyltransferase family 2 protein [Candidatus Bipolaricaulaceae bacterium]